MKIKSTLITTCLTLFISLAIGQTVKIDGEIRPRSEFRNGYKVLPLENANSAFAISQRTRLNALYSSTVFNAYISMQDIRVWGDVNQLDVGAYNRFAMHQAWGEYFFNKSFSFKVGRQELVYDDSRIFGNVGWAQQARAHDLGLFKYEKNNLKLHFGLAFNQKNETLFGTDYYASIVDGVYTLNTNYKAMQFLWFHTKLGEAGLSFLILNNGMESFADLTEKFKTLYSQTIGARFTPKFGSTAIASAFYYQMGKRGKSNTSLSALYFALEANIKTSSHTNAILGFEYLSGTSLQEKTENPNELKSFAPLYGTNHKFNGHLDYFFVGNHGNNVGLIDIYATLKYQINKWSFFATPHYFMAEADVTKPLTITTYDNLDKGLGLEIDFGLSYAAKKDMKINIGLSQMFGTETLAYIQGHSATNNYSKSGTWAYLMFVFKPNFYTTQ
jgi:hypothetical protein